MVFSAETTRKLFLSSLLTASGLMVLLTAPPADACLCAGSYNEESAFKKSDAIFTGKVMASQDYDAIVQIPGNDSVIWTFAVDTVIKGKVANQLNVMVRSTDCAFKFELGARYQVYAGRFKDILETSNCSRTKQLALPAPPDKAAESQPPPHNPHLYNLNPKPLLKANYKS
jgi:hypothetical protein